MRARAGSRPVAAAVAAFVLACVSLASTALLAAPDALTIAVRSRSSQPGTAMLVTVTAPETAHTVSVRAFKTMWPAVRVKGRTWLALVGIDLDRAPGRYVLSVSADDQPSQDRDITVLPRQFTRRVLRVAPEYVNPPAALLARITTEADFLRGVYEQSSPDATWTEGFVRPVPHRANSSFGTRSVFNGEPRNPHAGTDFLSPAGTPIHAPAGGRVVAARDLFFTGNTVVIDHGLGVFSMLAHLSRLDVHEGQQVARGDVVGLVGATGRVTGPHLHWALRVGPARVDPVSVLNLSGDTQRKQ